MYRIIQISEVKKSGRKKQNKGKVEASTLGGKTLSYVADEEDMALKRTLRKKSPTKALGKMTTKKKVVKEVQCRKSRASVTLKRTSVKAAKVQKKTKKPCVIVYTDGAKEIYSDEEQARIQRQSLPCGKEFVVFPTKKGAAEFLNSSERRPNMKQSAVACVSDNPYFSSFGKASVDHSIVNPEKKSKRTATEAFLNSISDGASVTKLSAFEGTPEQKGFLQEQKGRIGLIKQRLGLLFLEGRSKMKRVKNCLRTSAFPSSHSRFATCLLAIKNISWST